MRNAPVGMNDWSLGSGSGSLKANCGDFARWLADAGANALNKRTIIHELVSVPM
jgi:hypothetical protein